MHPDYLIIWLALRGVSDTHFLAHLDPVYRFHDIKFDYFAVIINFYHFFYMITCYYIKFYNIIANLRAMRTLLETIQVDIVIMWIRYRVSRALGACYLEASYPRLSELKTAL